MLDQSITHHNDDDTLTPSSLEIVNHFIPPPPLRHIFIQVQLLEIIRSSPRHEACVCDMTEAVGVSQPTVSHHLKVLTEAGLLTRERRGTWAWFTLVPERLSDIRSIFD